MSLISDRLSRFKPSLTVKISQKARELSMKGEKIISLSSGEPDFDTPDHIKSEAINTIIKGMSKIQQHKLVYKSLKGKMGNELHALSLTTEEK